MPGLTKTYHNLRFSQSKLDYLIVITPCTILTGVTSCMQREAYMYMNIMLSVAHVFPKRFVILSHLKRTHFKCASSPVKHLQEVLFMFIFKVFISLNNGFIDIKLISCNFHRWHQTSGLELVVAHCRRCDCLHMILFMLHSVNLRGYFRLIKMVGSILSN